MKGPARPLLADVRPLRESPGQASLASAEAAD
jgi:hypothetical protein